MRFKWACFLYYIFIDQVPANFGTIQKTSLTKPHLPIELPEFGTMVPHQVRTETRPVQVIVNFTQYCPPVEARGLFWNLTKAVSYKIYKYVTVILTKKYVLSLTPRNIVLIFHVREIKLFLSVQEEVQDLPNGLVNMEHHKLNGLQLGFMELKKNK